MSKNVRTKEVDALFDAVLSLKDREECYLFFGDVCTINELLSLSQRFEVAKMLQDGKTYLEIAEKTGASTAMQWSLTVSKTTNKRFSKTAVWSNHAAVFLCSKKFSEVFSKSSNTFRFPSVI